MARLARVVAPGIPHHITQRGNRRQQTFFRDADYKAYIELMAEWCEREGVQIGAHCPNSPKRLCLRRPQQVLA